MIENKENTGIVNEETKKKRGRKPKGFREEYVLNKDKTKFYVDLKGDTKHLNKVFNLLEQSNDKEFGREVTFKDLVVYGLSKISEKDIEKIRDKSLTEMEKVERTLIEYNQKNGTNLKLGEFLVKKLSI